MADDVLHSEDRCESCGRILDCCGLCPKHGGGADVELPGMWERADLIGGASDCDWEEDR